MNAILIGLIGIGLAFAAGTWYGTGLGEDREYAKRERESNIIAQTRQAAQEAAASEISKIKPRNVTIKQEVEREVRTNLVYRDCRHSPDGLRLINEALTGKPQPADSSKLPGTESAK